MIISAQRNLPGRGAVEAKPVSATPDPGLGKAAAAFEAMILRQMLAAMRSAKLADDPLGSSASDTFREMADSRTADSMAASGLGIATLLLQQFQGQISAQKAPYR
jgi:peptidoglycan hydrolase FlgJ